MFERVLYTTLTEGIAEIQGEIGILERHFQYSLFLDEAEVEKIVTFFTSTPPNVIHHYARDGDKVPIWAITLISERETQQFLGDDVGMIGELVLLEDGDPDFDPDDPDSGADAQGRLYTSQFGVLTYTEHPDVTRYYYELAKMIMQRARLFGQNGITDIRFSGRDLAPDPRYIPAHLFCRQLVVEVEHVQCLSVATPTRATSFGGDLFIDDGVDAARKGYVTPGITVTDGT